MANHMLSLVLVVALAVQALADTHTVAVGMTENLSGLTETARFVKDGAGTLVLSGDNSLRRATVKEGDLTFGGGSTVISDSHDGNGNPDDNGHIFAMSGGNLTLKNGAALTMSTTDGKGYAIQHGGTFMVTNATLDTTGVGEYMNGFESNGPFSESRFVIANGGVVRAKVFRPSGAMSASLKDKSCLDLDKGGELYLDYFFGDSNIRYGRINFNGGVVHPLIAGTNATTRLFLQDETRKTWTDGGVVPTVREGGFYLHTTKNNQVYVKFESGAERDGGAHFSGKGALYWRTKGSTYNGGTWLESNEGAVLALNSSAGDSALGALPAEPATNIWVTGSNHTLFSEGGTTEIEGNRTIFVKDGRRLYTGSQGRLVIKGEIRGEIAAGSDGPTGVALHAKNNWNGTTVLNPGEGRTNDVGRLVDYARLEITSGVTRVVSAQELKTYEADALVFVSGNNSAYHDYKGHLLVNGGTLANGQTERYIIAQQYAQVEVTNGGTIDTPGITYVNGLRSPATLTIADGGCVCVTNFQIANSSTSVLNLMKGGVLDTMDFWSNADSTGIINFDGGSIRVTRSVDPNGIYLGQNGGAARWVKAQLIVKEGGVVFDTANRHLWLRHPLQSGAEHDGGLRKIGTQILVVESANTYNGPTRIERGSMQVRTPVNGLPVGTTIILMNNSKVAFSNYDSQRSHTTQTVARVEGDGQMSYNSKLTVTDGVAPSADGTLAFEYACSLSGDFEILGNAMTCGCLKVAGGQDISNLTLKMADADALDTHAKANFYKILDAPDGFAGAFRKSADWPVAWDVKYSSDGKSAYVYHVNGTQILFR